MAGKLSDAERLIVIETKLEAVLESQRELIRNVETLRTDYVKKQDYDEDIGELHIQIKEARARTIVHSWLTGILATAFGAIMAILIQAYFTK